MTTNTTPADATVDDLLRATVCARCGYDLNGLSANAGTCPECGRPYGGPEVCLYGYAAGTKATDWTRPPQTRQRLVWRWVWSVAVLSLFAWLWRWQPFFRMYWYWPASVAVGLAVATWRGMSEQPSDAVQVRLSPAGVAQLGRGWGPIPYDRVDRKRPVPWRNVGSVKVRSEADGQVRLTLSSTEDWWKPRRDYVDAVVRCPPNAMAALHQRVADWRGRPNGPFSPG